MTDSTAARRQARRFPCPRGLRAAALLSLLIPAVLRAQDTARVVTLDEAVELALRTDPDAVSAASAVASSRATLLQARGAWLPALSLNSGYGNSSNERFDQASGQLVSESYTAQVAATYEIFSGGRRLANQRNAAAQLRAADAQEHAQRFQTILDTKAQFYEAAAAAELVGTAEQRLARARQQLTFATTRLDVGTATRSDVLRAELEVGNAELARLDAQSDLRAARLQLGRQIGVDDEVQPAPGALPEQAPDLPDAEILAGRAERVAPTALAARAALAGSRAVTRSSYASYLPSINASVGYDWFSFSFPPEQESWSLRLFASLPVFNGFAREAVVARARAAERTAEARARDAAIGARLAAENAAREIESAEQRVRIAARAVELAREDLRVQEERYRIGAATILDLQTSQLALSDAEVARVRARQALGVAVAQLETVLGEPLGESPDSLPGR